MAVRVKVSGIDTLIENIEEYSEKVQVGILKEIKDWSVRTESAAKNKVPVKTGELQKTIRTEVSNNGLTWSVLAGGINGVNYAPFVEFGTGAGVDQAFLTEYGLVDYADDFRGREPAKYPIPANSFLYRNARIEFEKSLEKIKKLIQKNDKT
jgi:hypothetical protein